MTPNEKANQAAAELVEAVRSMNPLDPAGEYIIPVRCSVDPDQSYMSWDWFWRPKTDKEADLDTHLVEQERRRLDDEDDGS
jgi:hypothetical protein